MHGKGARTLNAADLQLERFLEAELLIKAKELPLATTAPSTVLLTGANGFFILCFTSFK